MRVHENLCIYKDTDQTRSNLSGPNMHDSDTLVDCMYRDYGCRVRMPPRNKYDHETNCNYRNSCAGGYPRPGYPSDYQRYDPDEMVDCRWAFNGCRVRPKYSVKERHESSCYYKPAAASSYQKHETTFLS